MHIAIVWNGQAGSAAAVSATDIADRLARETAAEVSIIEVSAEQDPGSCARAAIALGAKVIIAAGGDGTVSGVASELIGTTVDLGILPLGTSNSFAAALGIPPDLDGALAMIVGGDRRMLDAGIVECGGEKRAMILHCMVGFHADVISQTSVPSKQRWGVLAYAASAVRQLASVGNFAVELDTGAHVVRCQAVAVAVANLAPIKCVLAHGPSHLLGDDGRVDVTIIAAETMAEALATGVHLYRSARDGVAASRDNVGSFSTSRVQITAEPAQRVLVDGEPFGDTPVTIETIPRAFRVLAPAAPHAEGPPVASSLIGLPGLEIETTT